MAALGLVFSFCIWLLLSRRSSAKNDAPCQLSKWNNGYDTFVKRHLPSGTPGSLDQNDWERFIRNKGCNRPTQSFLRTSDLERVRDVCTSRGGKVYKGNLCISRRPFTFVTVRSEVGTCGIKSVREETKHLILACELLSGQQDQCLPVHFEGNPEDAQPDNNARGCRDPQNHAPGPETTRLWLLPLLVLAVIYGY
ncbi:uncharacterized protein LOC114843753 [Betta splendens]|uniref:Uncharacterized protein LOC114843753 n=1 Tax=Betta splendens TaxID=158456 RepID=A0A9W2XBA7_BETSP|nr:uncharacterized protein LOC114843753 [Betta splendens]